MEEIKNRVAESQLISIDLEEWLKDEQMVTLDIAESLFNGLIIKEVEFRKWLKEKDWTAFQDKFVGIYCSQDALIQTWVYMLIGSKLNGIAKGYFFCHPEELKTETLKYILSKKDLTEFMGAKVVVKGCGGLKEGAYLEFMRILGPLVISVMYGEPCSAVPIYKKQKV